MKKQYLTAREVAEVCGVSDGKAYGLDPGNERRAEGSRISDRIR